MEETIKNFENDAEAIEKMANFETAKRKSDGAIGVYDKVSGTFLKDTGTGSFTTKPESSNNIAEAAETEEVPANIDEIEANYDKAPIDEVNDNRTVEEKQWDAISSNGEINLDTIKDLTKGLNVTDIATVKAISDLIKRKIAGEKFNEYKELPDQLKQYINFQLAIQGCPGNKTIRNSIAKSMLDNLASDYRNKSLAMDLDTIIGNFESDVRKITDDFSKDMGNTYMENMNEEKIAEMDAAIEKAISEGNGMLAAKITESKDSIIAAYDLTDFKEFCKRVKISKFDLEKPSRKYDNFLNKYEKSDNNIDDVRRCPDILDMHIYEQIPMDIRYKHMKFVLAFCDYIKNMNPNVLKDHTFMYYFVRNILVLDKINPRGETYDAMDERQKKFYDGLIANIKECEAYIK